MWAIIENGAVIQVVDGQNGVTINRIQHSAQIFTAAWTDKERANIGILPVEFSDAKNPLLWADVGVDYRVNGNKVSAIRKYKPVDLYSAKENLLARVRRQAARIINSVMPDFQQRNALAASFEMMARNGHDISKWPKEDSDRAAGFDEKWRKVQLVRDYSNKLEAEIKGARSVEALDKFDGSDGWPVFSD